MNEEEMNTSIRKFLNIVGVISQREIRHAVARALQEAANEERGYYVNTRAGRALFLRNRSDALWTSKTSVKRLLTILRSKGFKVRRVSICD